ncbi:TonB-linked outer membrane protein, SusC/RagA family [Algoriphagus locisalis]|uniref:TonB-linked outer membrane protein, SusC/RagA family n=1 Tax=Algoriphagus locisalis TaxID=305507 RepID=A0A1I7BRI4_9BACT|nr:SusC/RagA family TonB-linked outer membrane protein [Algoriphagus locisalis]SFT89814.1 TonB-linked outer membrane protein, SusC/RagA family [Algoriphagus locisalis]
MKKLRLIIILTLLSIGNLLAQSLTVSGKVESSEDGLPIPGASIQIKGTTDGVISDLDGNYTITVPNAESVLIFSFVGHVTQEEIVGNRSSIDVTLKSSISDLGEVIVTGVAVGTPTKKLGFAIGKVDKELLQEAPATDPGNAIRGKVSGVQIVQGTGRPGTAPTIRLRGVTAISGSQQPLIIVDGIITQGSLADINMNDVESMEVLKGAAASSLYGSLAGNGVIQIITKRGADREGVTRVTVRQELGNSYLAREVPLSYHHRYQLNPDGSYVLTNPNNPNTRVEEADGIMDNIYPQVFNNQELLFKAQPFYTTNVSIANTGAKTNFFMGFENLNQGGIVVDMPAYKRQSLRLNIDHMLLNKIKLTSSTLFINSKSPNNGENGQSGLFYPILAHEPDQDLYANRDGGILPRSQSNLQNPLYELRHRFFRRDRKRLLQNVEVSYQVLDWLRLSGQYSMDLEFNNNENYTPKGYITQNTPQGGLGSLSQTWSNNSAEIATLTAAAQKKFGNWNTQAVIRYQFEKYLDEANNTSGSNFAVVDIPRFSALDPTTLNITNSLSDVRAENIFLNLGFDYKDKYIIEGLVRRDGSSLFGEDERYQLFYRGTAAYRLSEDVQIPGFQELKLRASYGTSGARPGFSAQYETYSLSRGVATKSVLGNRFLKPSKIGELEVGLNATFLNTWSFEFNYANIKADDQILQVPLSSVAGFSSQWQNAGTVRTHAYEFSLGSYLIENQDFSWNFNIVASNSKSTVEELGVPTILRGDGITSGMFRIAEGEEFGVMYGNVFAKSPSDFILDNNGFITNISGYLPDSESNKMPSDFEQNSDGYMVAAGTENTPAETATILYDPTTGQKLDAKIGNSAPDLILGLTNTLRYKNISLFVLMDAQIGGDIYNSSKQNLYFQERHGDLDQFNKPEGQRKSVPYYSGATSLYNGAAPAQHFVEKATYMKLREIALTYRVDETMMNSIGIGKIFHDAKISVIGRNLLTFTDYSGFDPEVASLSAGDPTTFRSDSYVYPMFRTFTAAIELRF